MVYSLFFGTICTYPKPLLTTGGMYLVRMLADDRLHTNNAINRTFFLKKAIVYYYFSWLYT